MSEPQNPITQTTTRNSSLGVPIAIVIAACLIAGAIIYTGSGKTAPLPTPTKEIPTNETPEVVIEPITADDHMQGSPTAPIVIVEYSDYDCPFCKNFHETMNKIMDEFGGSGKVAWVYRHFPLTQLHPNAPKIAEASECVTELGGNTAFWTFTDLVFSERAVNAPTDMNKLVDFATQAGVNADTYTACVNSGKYAETVKEDTTSALNTGARGTPYSFVIVGDSRQAINGAQPFANVRAIVQAAIDQL